MAVQSKAPSWFIEAFSGAEAVAEGYPCSVCGQPTTSQFGVCQRTPECRVEFHHRADKKAAWSQQKLLEEIIHLVPGVDRQLANLIVSEIPRSKRTIMLVDLFNAMRRDEKARKKYLTDGGAA